VYYQKTPHRNFYFPVFPAHLEGFYRIRRKYLEKLVTFLGVLAFEGGSSGDVSRVKLEKRMKRLPLILCVMLLALLLTASSPILMVVYLLGGNEPFFHLLQAANKIVGWDTV
jgi:hypothetical protein